MLVRLNRRRRRRAVLHMVHIYEVLVSVNFDYYHRGRRITAPKVAETF